MKGLFRKKSRLKEQLRVPESWLSAKHVKSGFLDEFLHHLAFELHDKMYQ